MSVQSPRSDFAFNRPLPVILQPVTPLNVPRRRTLCTETVAAYTPVPGHSRFASSSWTTRRVGAVPISIDVGADTGRKIRPLPPIPPSPKSAPPMPRRQTSHASLRPLPCVPEAGVSVSVTPASPLGPPTPVVQSNTHLRAPSTIPAPRRFASLSLRLNTSPDALELRVPAPPLPSPPPTPSIPEPPSPATAQRKRMSKLRRHLGESVQLDLFPDPGENANIFGEVKGIDVYSQTVVAVKKLLELDSGDDTGSEDDDEEYSLVLTHEQAHRTIPVKRYSRKWIREKGGERWVEENYLDILRDLRAL
ncbi:hypothetical protein DFH09DRAFT_1138389 [Mycena vulgaris]|nr:hypothetical protein DFH09DRAFT_1138389 [Mycena vulgaris]